MRHVSPAERFDRHANSRDLPDELIRKALLRHGMDPQRTHVHKLSGGFQNANYLADDGRSRRVFRFYSSESEVAEREFGLLYFLQGAGLPVPRPAGLFEIDGKFVGVMQHIEGSSLQERLVTVAVPLMIFESAGRTLARIHHVKFDRAGFIGPGVSIDGEFDSFGVFARDYINKILSTILPERLEDQTRTRLARLVREQWPTVLETEPSTQLVHCDFNAKNLLISESRVDAILDWEFALSGNGYIDIGNFFRFSFDYPDGAERAFQVGYESTGGRLHPRWLDIGRLLDLTSVCSFLERRENYQKTFRTARWVIESTLAHFGY